MDSLIFLFSFFCATACLFFAVESFWENEIRAPRIALAGTTFFIFVGGAVYLIPIIQPFAVALFFLIGLGCLIFLIPNPANPDVLKGPLGQIVAEPSRFDERDTVFARNRSLPPLAEAYRTYYASHPDKETKDAERRNKGGPVGRTGAIDNEYPPNVAMIDACFQIPPMLGIHAQAAPKQDTPHRPPDPKKASAIVKGFSRHLGADLVGICRVNPKWTYSHRGEIHYDNWNDWGKKIELPLPFSVVIATEMEHEMVKAGPHTPALMASAKNYAKGAFIVTALSRWFASMGYRASAQHSRPYA